MLPRLIFATTISMLLLATGAHAAGDADASTAADAKAKAVANAPQVPSYSLRAKQVVQDLVNSGQTDIDELVNSISSDSAQQLDHIVINLNNQTIYECNICGQVLRTSRISSGRPGLETPPGNYKVENKSPKAYSQKYDAWMLNWMAFTNDGNYGMHGLEGSSYERHLGSQASHGCVRLSRKYAKDLYTRVKVGMPVTIVNDSKLHLDDFKPISHDEALSLVLEILSPTDPKQVFY